MIDSISLSKITSFFPSPSRISHHNASCCSRARSWLVALDRANSFISGDYDPPTWLRRQYGWAPHIWPIYWCQIPQVEDLDCGSLAALATELFVMRGQTAFQVQLALEYPPEAVNVWTETWQSALGHADWISDRICYHEACALPSNTGMDLWDPTECRWISALHSVPQSYGRLIALRVVSEKSISCINFNGREIIPGEWVTFSTPHNLPETPSADA